MATQKGKDLLLKIDDGSGYITVAGLRTKTLSFNAQSVDVTHADSAGRWRELLAGAGVKRANLAASGIFKDAASDALVRQKFFDDALCDCQLVIPDFGTVTGSFHIGTLEFTGAHDGELTFEITLESAGEIAFTVA
ncbi:MAG TPA: phage major tail protein, TP901-1 family [Xanthobacteraceae bacterium]|jgi:TP901-1 family phage major tail protein|nr:phage major tail protein, TP901-1 family [Xanthobacteraceae bacterium]